MFETAIDSSSLVSFGSSISPSDLSSVTTGYGVSYNNLSYSNFSYSSSGSSIQNDYWQGSSMGVLNEDYEGGATSVPVVMSTPLPPVIDWPVIEPPVMSTPEPPDVVEPLILAGAGDVARGVGIGAKDQDTLTNMIEQQRSYGPGLVQQAYEWIEEQARNYTWPPQNVTVPENFDGPESTGIWP